MYYGKIIDTHAHIYPQKIADKAVKNIGSFYNIPMNGGGLISDLLEHGKSIGVERYIVHSTATTALQVRAINNFIHASVLDNPCFTGLITLHPDLTNAEIDSEIKFAENNGFKGIKLHPDFQKFIINDKRAFNIYAAAEGRLSILFHTGDKRYEYSKPHRLATVAKIFPRLKCIGAHFGGYTEWDALDCYIDIPNVYFDTSSSLLFLKPEQAAGLINKFGAEKFMFGSDFPMWNHDEELARYLKLNLSNEINEMILYKNARKFYGI